RGVKGVARALRDAGYEVIYTGLRQTPEMVVDAALQEDAQVIGLSIHSGAHMTLFPAVVDELKRRKATDIVVFGGGIIPEDDIAALKKRGVAEIFTPGTPLQEIVDWLRKRFPDEKTAKRELVVTIVPATLSWTACLGGSHRCQRQPLAPIMRRVSPTAPT